jgi:glutamate synthase (NADPH/NADH) small chain
MTLTQSPVTSPDALHVTVVVDRCAGCQECLVRCPTGAIALDVHSLVVVVDDSLCVGCQQCMRTCPFSAITVSGQTLLAPRIELVSSHPEKLVSDHSETRCGITSWAQAMTEVNRCLTCPDPTCVRGCPTHNDIPAFIRAIGEGDLKQAHDVLRRTSMMPDICSRVCDQALQCEGACSWSLAGEQPVAIGALERFVADNASVPPLTRRSEAAHGLEVAVVGSGPAGLSAAWELAESGAKVTVFEKDHVAGGLLTWGIPDFTLPATVAERPATALKAAGVEFRFGTQVDPSDIEAMLSQYDAVVLAVGAGQPIRLPVPGADLERVWDATRFLTQGREALLKGESLSILQENFKEPMVLVLGAGNTAMDVARTARRLGARAVCVDWMDRRFAPVRPDELIEAETEGVVVKFATTVNRLEGKNGRVSSAWLSRTRQRNACETPVVTEKLFESLEVDMVIMAMGYRLDPAMAGRSPGVPIRKTAPAYVDRRWLASGLMANPAPVFARQQPVGSLALGRESVRVLAGEPRTDRVWTVGDALTGPSTVVEAMAQGKEAARSIVEALPRRSGSLGEEPFGRWDLSVISH